MALQHVQRFWDFFDRCLAVYARALAKLPIHELAAGEEPNPMWLAANATIMDREHELALATAAIQDASARMAAIELAAAIAIPPPSNDAVDRVITALDAVNKAVRADQTLHAALQIGDAIAKQIAETKKLS